MLRAHAQLRFARNAIRIQRICASGPRVRVLRRLHCIWLACSLLLFASAAPAQEYLIGPGDVLRISVFQNPDLSLDARVSEQGTIEYPLIGTAPVGGLALPGAAQVIAERLKAGNFVLNPQVNILLLQAAANQVSVLGQVNHPGRYPIATAGGHLSQMLSTAGGVAPTGADVVSVTGTRDGKPFRREIDIVGLSTGASDDIALAGGDTLFVDRAPEVYIFGQVQRPGQYRLERGMTVIQAVAAAGGLTQYGTTRGIEVRRDENGKTINKKVALDDKLQNHDVVNVKERLF
jgi:polysaccharide export outer membrane protein